MSLITQISENVSIIKLGSRRVVGKQTDKVPNLPTLFIGQKPIVNEGSHCLIKLGKHQTH